MRPKGVDPIEIKGSSVAIINSNFGASTFFKGCSKSKAGRRSGKCIQQIGFNAFAFPKDSGFEQVTSTNH